MVKNPPANAGDIRDVALIPGLGRSPEGGYGNPTRASLPGESHGQRNLVGCSPLGLKEWDMTKVTYSSSRGLFNRSDALHSICVFRNWGNYPG